MKKLQQHWFCSFGFFLILVFTTIHGEAQPKTSFTWSKFQTVSEYSQCVFLFKHNQGYGSIVRKGVSLKVNLYDNDLKYKEGHRFRLLKNRERILEIWQHNNEVFMLTQVDLVNQRLALRLRKINLYDLKTASDYQDIQLVNKSRFSRNLSFHLSRKDSSINIWHPNTQETENASPTITASIYSYAMLPLDKAIIELPGKAELTEILRVDDVDKGNFLIYTKEFEIRAIEKRGFAPNYKFVFYLVNPGKSGIKSLTFKDENLYLERGRLKWDNGILEGTGLFTEKTDGPKLGIWYVQYNFNESKLLKDTIQYFSKPIRSLPNNGFQSTLMRHSRLESFYIDFFVKADSGKRVIVTEQFFLLPAAIGASYTYNRFYGDILVLYMNEKSEIYNAHRLIKAQQTYNNLGEFSSYYLERKDSTLMFFYNDNHKNKNSGKFRHLVWHKHSELTMAIVNPHAVIKYPLVNYKTTEGILQVRDMRKLSPNEYLVYARKKKRSKIGILKIDY